MKMQWKKLALVLVLALTLTLVLGACGEKKAYSPEDVYVEGAYDSLWNTIGTEVNIEDVKLTDGYKAVASLNGKDYELGMDFLSMAMVYSTSPAEGATKEFDTALEIYNEWWKLYMLRWNYLMPEIPLYANIYYDFYNSKIEGFETDTYWQMADAIVDATIKGENSSVILGAVTELSGLFRNASFGKASPGAADLDVQKLMSGYDLVVANKKGDLVWADSNVVKSHTETLNEDGTKTFTIEIAKDLKFSDGSPITAKNYVAALVAGSTVVSEGAGGGKSAGLNFAGYKEFVKYDGKDAGTKEFSGVRIIDDYTLKLTLNKENADYYYGTVSIGLSPIALEVYLGDFEIKDDGKGAYLPVEFYEMADGTYKHAKTIRGNIDNTNTDEIPVAGPYAIENWNASNKELTLKINENFKGDHRGKPSIEKIVYRKIVAETQLDQFKNGEIDVLSNMTEANEIKAGLAAVAEAPEKFKEINYVRAGYGKLGFRADFGPTSFAEVRQAIAYSIDREYFATTFTEGYGTVVHGAYCPAVSGYAADPEFFEKNLQTFSVSSTQAIEVLKKGGWVYNEDGTDYVDGSGKIRYKKLAKEEQTVANLEYAALDGTQKTVKVGKGDDYAFYMPLVINWFATVPNPVTELLISTWQNSAVVKEIGMVVNMTTGDFTRLTGELTQDAGQGWSGKSIYSAFNFATGFNSTVYDYAYNWTIDPDMYNDYSICYVKDAADYVWAD